MNRITHVPKITSNRRWRLQILDGLPRPIMGPWVQRLVVLVKLMAVFGQPRCIAFHLGTSCRLSSPHPSLFFAARTPPSAYCIKRTGRALLLHALLDAPRRSSHLVVSQLSQADAIVQDHSINICHVKREISDDLRNAWSTGRPAEVRWMSRRSCYLLHSQFSLLHMQDTHHHYTYVHEYSFKYILARHVLYVIYM